MDYQILPGQQNYTKSWVSYLDLLGFTDLVNKRPFVETITLYEQVCEQAIRRTSNENNVNIGITWFSDTFLLYSPDDTYCSFFAIDYATLSIINNLITKSIPVRGAMSCGDFAADRETSAFFGPALIEAYHYGENQDWIGFILTPSAVNQLTAIDYYLSEVNYSCWNIPYKKAACCTSAHKDTRILQKSLPAYIIGNATRAGVAMENKCLNKLCAMRANLKDPSLIKKYTNTIDFIENKQMKLGEG